MRLENGDSNGNGGSTDPSGPTTPETEPNWDDLPNVPEEDLVDPPEYQPFPEDDG